MHDRLNGAIDKAADRSEAFVNRIARSWRPIAGVAVALLLFSIATLWITLYRPFASKASSLTQMQASVPTSTSTDSGMYRALDGVAVADTSSTRLLPLGVMVENSVDARPLSGVAKANVVIEAPVEGSITRFFLLFDPSTKATEIGPVRSARPYYVDFANGIGAQYAHVGGSQEALDKIKATDGFKDLDQFFNDRYFWRSNVRPAPHNVYTSTDKLVGAAEQKERTGESSFASWTYENATGTAASNSSSTIEVPYAGAYEASWAYDASSGLYTRSQNGKTQRDADGTVVKAKNIVLIQTDVSVIDDYGRLRVRTTGSGTALITHDGKTTSGTWKRTDGNWFTFTDAAGRDIPFGRGTTWISVLPDLGQ